MSPTARSGMSSGAGHRSKERHRCNSLLCPCRRTRGWPGEDRQGGCWTEGPPGLARCAARPSSPSRRNRKPWEREGRLRPDTGAPRPYPCRARCVHRMAGKGTSQSCMGCLVNGSVMGCIYYGNVPLTSEGGPCLVDSQRDPEGHRKDRDTRRALSRNRAAYVPSYPRAWID